MFKYNYENVFLRCLGPTFYDLYSLYHGGAVIGYQVSLLISMEKISCCNLASSYFSVASLQQHRKNFGCCVFDDRILVLGGSVYGKLSYSVEKYSPSTNSWHYAPSLVSERQCCNAAVITVPCWDESTQTDLVDLL